MKKIITSLILISLLACQLAAQTIVSTSPENKNVILEEFTGIHNTYSPQGHAIAQGIQNANPDDVFLISLHTGAYAIPSGSEPDYRTQWGEAIDGQSGLLGYPAGTVNRHLFPGWSQGSGTAMSRNMWLGASNQILAQPSYLNVGIAATIVTSTRQLAVDVEVYYTGDSPESTNKLNVAIIQDSIFGPQTGGNSGNNYLHMHMLRHFLTGQWGVEISQTTVGTLYSTTFIYELPMDYNDIDVILEDIQIIAYVTETTQEVVSGNSGEITFIESNDYDAAIASALVPQFFCSNELVPEVTLKNYGEITLTSLDFIYSVNDGDEMTYSWTGNLNQLESEVVTLPSYEFIVSDINFVNITTQYPNGHPDELPQNDYFNSSGFEESQNFPENIFFGVMILANPEDVTWNITDSEGAIVADGGPYTNTGFQISPVSLTEVGCYTLFLNDASGQGLSGGLYLIADSNNNIIWEGDTFTYSAMAEIARGVNVDISETIPLSNGWSIISFYVIPDDLNLLNIYQPLVDSNEFLKSIDESGGFIQNIPGVGWMNTIGDMANTEGYYLKVTNNTSLDAIGSLVSLPYNIPLTTGWNIMGYPTNQAEDALIILDDLITASVLTKVINEAGGFIQDIPGVGWMNTIGNFEPDEGYYIKVSSDDTLTFEGTTPTWQCGDTIFDPRDGQVYNTVLIGDQCWMAENLNVGTRIDGVNEQTDNSTIEKYCYDDDVANCDTYGGLYQWDEMMLYLNTEGAQGICPDDWHIASDDEWKTMEMALGMSQSEADNIGLRGTDEGAKLKSTSGWNYNGNGTNSSSFTTLPGGYRGINGSFTFLGNYGFLWSSTENSGTNAYYRYLYLGYDQVGREYTIKTFGVSVRCIKD